MCLEPQILEVLPHTIRGVGLEFAAHESGLLSVKKDPEMHKKYGRHAAKLGFVVMVSVFVFTPVGCEIRSSSISIAL